MYYWSSARQYAGSGKGQQNLLVRGCERPLRMLAVRAGLCLQSVTRPRCFSRAVGDSQFLRYRAFRTGRTMACKRSGARVGGVASAMTTPR